MKDEDKLRAYEVDGIKEYDNPLPRWWVSLFVCTVIFGVIYFFYYHVGSGPSLTDEFAHATQKVQEIKKEHKPVEFDPQILTDSKRIEEGKALFASTCSPCHGPNGGGVIGPNLTDDHWINGCTKEAIFTTIKEGVPEKGMASWEAVFDDEKIRSLTAYVLSLSGTTPKKSKVKEGIYCDVKGSTPKS